MLERTFIYFPEPGQGANPGDLGLPYEEVWLTASDGVRLHGWLVPGRREAALLWLHGNAGNIENRLENLRQMHERLGVTVLLFDYRGYGRSSGSPSEQGLYRDAEAALRYLEGRDDVNADRIVYFGRSLGAAVAVELATRRAPSGLILESAFPSLMFMARAHYPYVPTAIVRAVIGEEYDSASKVGSLHVPLLLIHGEQDEIAPLEGGKRLYEAAKEPKELFTLPDAGHNDTYITGGQRYFDALERFLARVEDSAEVSQP